MNKKNAPYIFIISILVIGLVVFGISFFLDLNTKSGTHINARVYFRTDINNVDYEEYPVQIQDNKIMTAEVLSKFMSVGPKNVNLHKTTPADLHIIEPLIIRIEPERPTDSVFVINFTNEYYNMTPQEEMFFRATLTWSMTDLDFINNVEILVENKPLTNSLGMPMSLQNRQNIDIYGVLPPFPIVSRVVKLYFSDETGTKLLPEERTIDADPRLPVDQLIVEQIILGPRKEGYYPTVSTDVSIVDVSRKEGICFVNLSADFLSKGPVMPVTDDVAVYSIVDSLMEVTGVNKVQFLIDSENVGILKGDIDLSRQFDRNDEIIKDTEP